MDVCDRPGADGLSDDLVTDRRDVPLAAHERIATLEQEVDRLRGLIEERGLDEADFPARAAFVLQSRRRRARCFPGFADLFGDPAWDILLDLYVAQHRGIPVYISDACVAAGLPATTALRKIQTMTRRGLLERVLDKADRRRVSVTITDKAVHMIEGWLRLL